MSVLTNCSPGVMRLITAIVDNGGPVVYVEHQVRDKRTFRKVLQVRLSTVIEACDLGLLRYDPMTSRLVLKTEDFRDNGKCLL